MFAFLSIVGSSAGVVTNNAGNANIGQSFDAVKTVVHTLLL